MKIDMENFVKINNESHLTDMVLGGPNWEISHPATLQLQTPGEGRQGPCQRTPFYSYYFTTQQEEGVPHPPAKALPMKGCQNSANEKL